MCLSAVIVILKFVALNNLYSVKLAAFHMVFKKLLS